ncbi:GAF domain-containing DNA-binding protein [Alcaligenes endophyticus]|uniref:LytTR family transcriptional regulator DNA-binding domain-containing protein n=1 Tax=Alcaligenes endophyticus TaxID=1929088 RepID=A0ABT8EIK7_9BURK|nr:LytTR family transcriptional regulator DNA-binding domain-containing protein [Alcaligenes endophyticus]MCX5592400.1 LytTR family transcriptional regulator DNA-binding domain-containing protein [Alcaligenes endophyticus]MDN4121125.1 LytTR family transcriptional regulator DNA-binding domain-containing protein [Alcaligenes endophyticus]
MSSSHNTAVQPANNVIFHDPALAPVRGASDWLFDCADKLLRFPVDQAISLILSAMGETAAVDRAWMIEYRPDLLRFRNTHEWCRGKTTPYVKELQEVPTTLIAWLHRYMVKEKAVAIYNIHELPRSARAIQIEFIRQGDKSVLSVPVFCDDQLYGIIGFDTTVSYREWASAEVDALFQCARLIGYAKYGNGRGAHRAVLYEGQSPTLYLSMKGVVQGIQPEAILGVRSAGNYTEIWLANGSMVLDSRSLGMWVTLLPQKTFFRIHRTAVINALHVVEVDRSDRDRWLIRMRDMNRTWPVSRSYRKLLRERMGI